MEWLECDEYTCIRISAIDGVYLNKAFSDSCCIVLILSSGERVIYKKFSLDEQDVAQEEMDKVVALLEYRSAPWGAKLP